MRAPADQIHSTIDFDLLSYMAYFTVSYLSLPLFGARGVGYLQPHLHMAYRRSDTLPELACAVELLVTDPFLFLSVSSLCLLLRSRLRARRPYLQSIQLSGSLLSFRNPSRTCFGGRAVCESCCFN